MSENTVLRDLETLLDDEREVLRAGRLEELRGLEERRRRVMVGVPEIIAEVAPERLDALREQAQKNADLARAVSDGVRDAMRRLGDIRKASGPIGSYGADGAPVEIGQAQPAVERKA